LKLSGEENILTLRETICYAMGLIASSRFGDAKALLRKTLPVARRVLGENDLLPLSMRTNYARALYADTSATLGACNVQERPNVHELLPRLLVVLHISLTHGILELRGGGDEIDRGVVVTDQGLGGV